METYVVCIHDREVWRRRWRLWFSLFIASHESGQQQLEIQQTRANKHAYPSLIVLDGSYRWGSVDSICHGKCYVHLWVIRLVCHYTIRDRMQMSWLKYSYSMRFLFVSAIIIPSSCFFFFSSYLFIPRKCCKSRKKKKVIWFYRIVFRIKNAMRIVQLYITKTTFPWVISFFFFVFLTCKIELM